MKQLKTFEYYIKSMPPYDPNDEWIPYQFKKNVPNDIEQYMSKIDNIKIEHPKKEFNYNQHNKIFNEFKRRFLLAKDDKAEYERLTDKLREYAIIHPEIEEGKLKNEWMKLLKFRYENQPK